VLKKAWRYCRHPYCLQPLLIGIGVGVYFYLLIERYHPAAVLLACPFGGSLQDVVDWVLAVLTYGNMYRFFGWLILFALMVIFWLFFFAQFVLPVRGLEDRWLVFARLLRYAVGRHGPATFIQDGQLIQGKSESRRKGPGVMVLDTASAAVLFTEGGYTRAVGPGVVFTRRGEQAHKTTVLDLRLRKKFLGPKAEEDPFAPQGPEEPDEAYEERQRRRWETSAKTRDGTEVVVRMMAVFYLDDHPDGLSEEAYESGKFQTRFKGHAEAAWRAVTHQPLDAEKTLQVGRTDEALLEWGWLPIRLAVDLWREYLQRFRLNDLFLPLEGDQTALAIILQAIRERLTQPYYREMGNDGVWTGAELPSREYALLQERGIRVSSVSILSVVLPEEVEQALVHKWTANWLVHARREREIAEHRRMLARKRGAEVADILWGRLMTQRVCSDAESRRLSRAQCLERTLYHLRRAIQSDPALYAAHKHELAALEMMWAWARNRAVAEASSEERGQ